MKDFQYDGVGFSPSEVVKQTRDEFIKSHAHLWPELEHSEQRAERLGRAYDLSLSATKTKSDDSGTDAKKLGGGKPAGRSNGSGKSDDRDGSAA